MKILESTRLIFDKIKYEMRRLIKRIEMNGKYDVRQVAHYFVSRENNQEIKLTKLMKLCYYAQAWYIALYNDDVDHINNFLEKTEYEAWVHGPVSRILYNYFSNKKNEDETIITLNHNAFNEIKYIDDNEDLEFLERVWNTYGDKTGFDLEALTHSEMPWQKARAGLPYYAKSTKVIQPVDMFEFYRSIYEK